MLSRVYLDYNATTPIHPEILPFVAELLSKFGNASSIHWAGRESKKIVSQSREQIARYLNCDPLEVVFTSGGSEANNLALKGALGLPGARCEIICSRVEHPSVIKTMEYLRRQGYIIRWLGISRGGKLNIDEFRSLLCDRTALISLQLVNNETGNIFPIKQIAELAHERGALVHSDMVQALGKLPIDVRDMGIDLASFAGHKFYSPKGVGVLYVARGTHLEPLVLGGGQERGRRAGTKNVVAIGGLGEAIRVLGPRVEETMNQLGEMRDHLEAAILAEISGATINGGEATRVANTTNTTLDSTDGETMLINLDTRGFAVSSGAACSSGNQEPSPVLLASGLSREEASQSLRISLGWLTTEKELNGFIENLILAVKHVRDVHRAESEKELCL